MSNADLIALTNYLGAFITDAKKRLIEHVLLQRTQHITIVLDNLFQEHNASAVVRTAECFGLMDIHAIETDYKFKLIKGMEMGSAKWLTIHRYKKIEATVRHLKTKNYDIIGTTLDAQGAIPLEELTIHKKMALVFGTEKSGLSKEVLAYTDRSITIPMHGFTQSLNVSVSAALCLYSLMQKVRMSNISWRLSPQDLLYERLRWYRAIIPHSDCIERYYFRQRTL